ncbi:MAG: class I SAM-dependent methyltransferase [Patescibacteria group bacterium]|jgi:ubiquinone/menaquinone biosynthesis C-methylase UbiE
MKSQTVQKILEQTKNDYDTIASDFDCTRRWLWPGLDDFKNYVKAGDRILDLGCGNGKLRLLFKDINLEYIGLDNSQKLLAIAESDSKFKIANQKFIKADVTPLSFPDNYFDVVFFIAVFHHIPSDQLRQQTLEEIRRVLKPGGILVMANWNHWRKEHLHYIIKYTWLKMISKSDLDFKDIFLPWMGGKVKRYFHAFTLGELKRLINKSGLKLEGNFLSYWDNKNKSKFNYLGTSNLVTIARKC